MTLVEKILLSLHTIAGAVWIGSVFMGAFIDTPAAEESVEKGKFPFKFIIGQGRRVFYSVYFGIFQLWATGILLLIVHPPLNSIEIRMMIGKFFFLFIMTAFTLYGTFITWPKIQLATDKEAYTLHKYYNYRAYGTFVSGILGLLLTLWFYLYKI
ncbi:hypothetical protein [Flavivirga jejuensis]|uniref:Copper resistance protein D n=1 Tax=Flavivirga jejuensis TaxID=870487 RepID=A0ABT8WNB8_9FLAO|nr:hypothetical protein [Flavivirga jejuensis]MDO5974411.1 hypothetical protein [Flavivirga jejuensis]